MNITFAEVCEKILEGAKAKTALLKRWKESPMFETDIPKAYRVFAEELNRPIEKLTITEKQQAIINEVLRSQKP